MVGKFSVKDTMGFILTVGGEPKKKKQTNKYQYKPWEPATCDTKEEVLRRCQWIVSPEEYNAVHDPFMKIMQREGMHYSVTDFDPIQRHELVYGEAYFDIDNTNIVLCSNPFAIENNILKIPTIAHEMGHWYDIMVLYKGDAEKHGFETGTLEMEVRAWEFAVEYLKEAGYTHWEEFNVYMKQMLGTYYNCTWGFHRDRHFGYTGEVKRTFEEATMNIMARV